MVGIKDVEPANIPVIDFRILSAGTPQERKDALEQLDDALKSYGFVYLSNHSVGQAMVDEAMSWSRRFFSLPINVKKMIAHPRKASDHRGYVSAGTGIVTQGIWDPTEIEKLRETAPIEQMENLETGNPYLSTDPNDTRVARNRLLPEEIFPGFQSFHQKWWDVCIDQELQILRFLCEILGIPDLDYLGKQQTPEINCSQFGWNHYLSTPLLSLQTGSNRLNTHTDFGQLTLLFQDMVGGLESHDHDAGIFRPVLPKPGTMIVQVGDMLEKQSNGRWRSALHHVTAPRHLKYGSAASEDTVTDRYSIGFFVHPDYETAMDPLPGCDKKGKWSSLEWHGEKTAGEWLMKRVALEYEY
ncbi:oxidoreductase 2OG-Fe(II) oxygenase family [Penicillium paradoxum]|uniref:oxidoreductase 2OG-Fe(II) oxygenase family n=1 Tax=Penicillium paradoxum TaxID=176176 RepID=UPI002548E4E8|nr:oxidoreductase 2OG-Fe(II) oxygenase family [Penicillium paradoxum]KAJ5780432.1 oxidoreductase 2OG-Fe(II) oxygenase family [Penicillium paradoxum]